MTYQEKIEFQELIIENKKLKLQNKNREKENKALSNNLKIQQQLVIDIEQNKINYKYEKASK